jgi:hypothetical protein
MTLQWEHTSVTQAAEEEKSIDPEVMPPSEEQKAEAQPESTLVDALRQFVRHEAGQPEEKPAPEEIRPFQMFVLLVLVLDIVLLYNEFQDWFENPLFVFALKVLPWLLGATAFAYSDKARKWILTQCQHKLVGAIAILIALPLLIMRQPLFSVIASVSSDSVSIDAENPTDKLAFTTLEPGRIRITVPDLRKRYSIQIKDTDESRHSSPFKRELSRWQLIRGTIAQLLLFGDVRLQLKPLYMVVTSSPGGASATIEGRFDDDFLDRNSLDDLRCSRATSTQPGLSAIHCRVDDGLDSFKLPPGKYNFTLFRNGCKDHITIKDREVLEGGNSDIDFSGLCPA